jgi:hypothetical protein
VQVEPTPLDRLLWPLHRWVWQGAQRRGRKLLRFAETEASGGRDLARAAELTSDPLLRRLFLRHSEDEQRHALLFRSRARTLLQETSDGKAGSPFEADWLAPGERGFDELRPAEQETGALLAFLHLSERAAAGRFALYRTLLAQDPVTRDLFGEILEDEVFHMAYTRSQLARIAPQKQGLRLWQSRLGRAWKAYLRLALFVASLFGTLVLTAQYFLLLPLFVLPARRAARREPVGLATPRARRDLTSQY